MTTTLVSRSDFVDAQFAVIQAAAELYGIGSREALRSAEAFDAVGIIDVPANPNPDPVAPVDGDDSVIFTFFDAVTGEYYLGRREADLGDPVQGSFLTAAPVELSKVSVTADGAIAAYVDAQSDVYLVDTAAYGSEQCLGFPGTAHSVAVSADGNTFAFVLLDGSARAICEWPSTSSMRPRVKTPWSRPIS